TEGVKWFRKAAEQGNAQAQYNLGICYTKGCGVTQDKAEGLKWLRKAADQGDEDARNAIKAFYID
ncbi:MAG: sel1 repeat family protein, partial [Thermoguttaceae bacterium]|nr:sel1 repeat family protein [Thermoguttaceae bacterium]